MQSLEEETTTLRENLQHIGRELSDVSHSSTCSHPLHIRFTAWQLIDRDVFWAGTGQVSHESRSLVEQKRRQEAHYQVRGLFLHPPAAL